MDKNPDPGAGELTAARRAPGRQPAGRTFFSAKKPTAEPAPADIETVPASNGESAPEPEPVMPSEEPPAFAPRPVPYAAEEPPVRRIARRPARSIPAGTSVAEDPLSGRSVVLSRKRRFARAIFHIAAEAVRLVATTILVIGITTAVSYIILREYVAGKEVGVPYILGDTVPEALEKLKPTGLTIELERREYSENIARDGIVEQNPEPNKKVKSGTPVRVVISDGRDKIRAPQLVGKAESAAQVDLSNADADLAIGQKSFVHSTVAPKGEIIAQDPPPGAFINRDAKINVLISLGAPPAS